MVEVSLTVVTIVEPRLLVVVTGTPVRDAVFLPAPPVAEALELPSSEGKAVAVVTKVVPRESVVVMATPPETKAPIVEVILRPAVSVPVWTTTLAVLTGAPVSVTVDASRVVAKASLLLLAEPSLLLLADT